ncbi:hypothetical protein EMPG_10753, partial [Blastomyces silverae]
EADTVKITHKNWLQKQGFNPNLFTATISVAEISKFCDFKNDYSYIEMKIITKLSELKDYNI